MLAATTHHFGVLVGGAYVACAFATAMAYPMACTTRGKVGGCKDGVQGGTLLAYDGTYPLRAVVRCVAKRGDYLWRKRPTKGNSQYVYMPKSMFITHIPHCITEHTVVCSHYVIVHVDHSTISVYNVMLVQKIRNAEINFDNFNCNFKIQFSIFISCDK